jgi:nucleoside-diphosphate-sugar epimerase
LLEQHQIDIVTRRPEVVIDGASAVMADISENNWIERAGIKARNYDIICHMAYASTEDTAYDRKVSVESVRAVLHCFAHSAIRHFVYIGSMTVFGEQMPKGQMNETNPHVGATPYSINKVNATREVMEADVPFMVSVLHPTGVYDGKSKRLTTYAQILRSGYIHTPCGARGYNNVVHADDVAGAIIACVSRRQGRRAEEYIINGEVITYADWFAALERTLGLFNRPRIPPFLAPLCRGCLRRLALTMGLRPPVMVPDYKAKIYEREVVFSSEKAVSDFGFTASHRYSDTLGER